MDRVLSSSKLAELDRQIWQTVREEFEDVDEEDAVASAVVEVLGAVRGSLKEMSGTARGLSDQQRAMAEGMAGVLAQVVDIVRDSQSGLVEAAKLTDGQKLADAMGKLEKCIEEDGAKTRKTMAGVTLGMNEVSRKLDSLADRLTAPKRIVTDAQGRPVGVETVMDGN